MGEFRFRVPKEWNLDTYHGNAIHVIGLDGIPWPCRISVSEPDNSEETDKTITISRNRDESGKRDYLYYLAIGNARIKEYQTALKFVRGLLQVEPGNRQAQELEQIIKIYIGTKRKKLEKERITLSNYLRFNQHKVEYICEESRYTNYSGNGVWRWQIK
mgnify:CR=1 FL=1